MIPNTDQSSLDLRITRTIQAYRSPWFDALMRLVSQLGYPPQGNLFGIILLLGLYLLRLRREALATLFAIAGSVSLFYATAFTFRRERPNLRVVRVSTRIDLPGFPSGHVLIFTSVFGFLFYRVWLSKPATPARPLLLALFGSVILLTGPARVYSGEHWASDVAAGYLLGGLWLAMVIKFYRWEENGYRASA